MIKILSGLILINHKVLQDYVYHAVKFRDDSPELIGWKHPGSYWLILT